MTAHDSYLADRQHDHDTPRCESCGAPADSDGLDDGLCPRCQPDDAPVGEVPPYLGRRGGVA